MKGTRLFFKRQHQRGRQLNIGQLNEDAELQDDDHSIFRNSQIMGVVR